MHGLPQRLGKAIIPSGRQGPRWEGVEGGGRLELDVQVQGDAPGEIFVGFFADPRWWSAEPVQVRRIPRPGSVHASTASSPGKFQLGAMVGGLPKPRRPGRALGLAQSGRGPGRGLPDQARDCSSRPSSGMCRRARAGSRKGFAGQWDRMDPTRMITVHTVDDSW